MYNAKQNDIFKFVPIFARQVQNGKVYRPNTDEMEKMRKII